MTDLRKAAEEAIEALSVFATDESPDGWIAIDAIRKLREALAQPEQEPAMWVTPDGNGFRLSLNPPINDVPLGWEPLYPAPPKREWVGLTDEDLSVCDEDGVLLARYWEAKLKEKNT